MAGDLPVPAPSSHPEAQILGLIRSVWQHGFVRQDRTGVGTRALFGAVLRFDLTDGTVPLMTTKRVFWKAAVRELLWFLSGETNIRPLVEAGVHIWTDWPLDRYNRAHPEAALDRAAFEARLRADPAFAARWGDLGPVYGRQWRAWQGADGRVHDQLAALVDRLRREPHGRRHLFTAWNVADLDLMALPPCHMTYQYFVADGRLSCALYQRSCDLGLGLAFNLFEAALLLRMLAQQCDLAPGELVWMGGDVHLYLSHAHLVEAVLARAPRPWPRLRLARRPPDLFSYRPEDVVIEGYDPHPHVPAPVAV